MSRMMTLDDLKKKENGEDGEKGQEYYSGGVDNRGGGSGLNVEDPNRPKKRGDAFDNLVEKAAAGSAAAAAESSEDQFAGKKKRKISLYKNGFVVDDNGVLRRSDDPANAEFLQALEQGKVPAELQMVDGKPTFDIFVGLEDRRGEEYTPPPPPAYTAFSGGNTLGSKEKAEVSDDADAVCVFTADVVASAGPVAVDDSKPCTTVQIKTPAGKKLRLKVNEDMSVLQLAALVARDSAVASSFTLAAGFPPKVLKNGSRGKTVKDAGLCGEAFVMANA